MASQELDTLVPSILKAIVHNSSEIELMLDSCLDGNISSWKDKNSLDLVHHCILENNEVALLILLRHDLFQPPHEPSTWPYLHLAACLGYSKLVKAIVLGRKNQNDSIILDWNVFNRAIKPRIKTCVPELKSEDKEKKWTPIDVAGLFGHIDCLDTLINSSEMLRALLGGCSHPRPDTDCLSMACRMNSPWALKLLVTSKRFNKTKSLECALKYLAPECVISFLEDVETGTQKAFSGMNMYHILYLAEYYGLETFENMIKITSLLIKYKQDVNALQPARTFPLYSFLSQKINYINEGVSLPFLLAGLKLLLQAGADPNINEIETEKKLPYPVSNTSYKRRPHSSAIHCFVGNVWFKKFSDSDIPSLKDPVGSSACQVIELLLKHNGDLNFVGHFLAQTIDMMYASNTYHFGTALHLLLSTRTHNLISHPVLSFMLQNGLDADTTGTWYMLDSTFTVRYALNVLPFSLWSAPYQTFRGSYRFYFMPYGLQSFESQVLHPFFMPQDLQIFAYVMKFMSQPALVRAYREFLEGVEFLRQSAEGLGGLGFLEKSHLQESDLFAEIVNEYEMEVAQPRSLQRCCSHAVWRACRKRARNVHDLPIPGPLKNIVLNFH